MDENEEKYISIIIEKPQSGKTFICTKHIKINDNIIHFILTMNTIISNKQFCSRVIKTEGNKVCLFNSKKEEIKLKDENNEVIDIYKASDVEEVISAIVKYKCNVIIMCAHYKRIKVKSKNGILKILERLNDSVAYQNINKRIQIHIDEAHEYVPPNRDHIITINNSDLIEKIILYTATPFKNWVDLDTIEKYNIFKQLFVIDVVNHYDIIRSKKYFGIKNCEIKLYDELEEDELNMDTNITEELIKESRYGGKLVSWLTDKTTLFSLGNEYYFIHIIQNILSRMNIDNNKYSYNFIPAYVRKVTHTKVKNLIYDYYSNAIVIIMNGNGSLYYMDREKKDSIIDGFETNERIEQLKDKYPNRPFFITGFHCIGMSVSLISEKLGNFDNVIFSHRQYIKDPDCLYQMCRLYFNYINWEKVESIKKTIIHTDCIEQIEICLEYEKQIEEINKHESSLKTLEEVKGNLKIKQQKLPIDVKFNKIKKYIIETELKKYTIDDTEDDDENGYQWTKLKRDYKKIIGKDLKGRSKPSKDENGFYTCSTAGNKKIFDKSDLEKQIKRFQWYSNYQFVKDKYSYARIYIGYNDIVNKNKGYVIYMRYTKLKKCKDVTTFLNKIKKCKDVTTFLNKIKK